MGVSIVKEKGPTTKHVGANSGRSISHENPTGVRRMHEGKPLAPRSLRKKGKTYLSECSEKELAVIGL